MLNIQIQRTKNSRTITDANQGMVFFSYCDQNLEMNLIIRTVFFNQKPFRLSFVSHSYELLDNCRYL